jgi:glycosyltransferase involved in cell wall biosynthesis
VATDVGGVRELMGDAGVLVPPRDWDALAAAMVEMMRRSREDRQTLGYAARARIQARFSMDTRANEWDVFYHSVVEPRLADRP